MKFPTLLLVLFIALRAAAAVFPPLQARPAKPAKASPARLVVECHAKLLAAHSLV